MNHEEDEKEKEPDNGNKEFQLYKQNVKRL